MECGRAISQLARTDTPYVVPVVPVVVGIQATTIVVQVVPIRGIVRGRRPPVPVAGIVERAIVVVSASNRGEGKLIFL